MKARYEVMNLGSRDGFAMAAALGVLTLLSVLVVTVFANAMASFRSGMTDLEKTRTYYAAEAGAESGMAQLALALEDAIIDDEELSAIVPPTIEGFTFDSFSVVRDGSVQTERITDGPFAGLFSRTQIVEITTVAVSPDYTSSSVMVTAKAQAIPIFQFGVFFEKDLEITNGPRMDFAGWVHSNGNIYLNSANQYFADVITTPNNLYHDRKDAHDTDTGTYIADATATYVNLDFDSRDTPDPNAFRTKSDASFDNRVKTNAYGVDSLRVPLPDGMDAIAVMQPRLGADGPLEKQAKFSWKADWYIEVDMGAISENSVMTFGQVLASIQFYIDAYPNTTIAEKLVQADLKVTDAQGKFLIPDASGAVSDLDGAHGEVDAAQAEGLPGAEAADLRSQINQLRAVILSGGAANAGGNGNGSLCSIGVTHTRSPGLNSPSTAQCGDIFSFTADKWYEGREQRYVDIIDIDVASLQNWAGGNANRATSLMYVTITNTTGAMDPAGDGIYPVVRLINANKLLAPMTFSTNHPLYTRGDYNSDPLWYPSALVADALTFLSNNWNDDQHLDPVQIRPIAADTDIYAAVMAGHSGTPCDHEVAGCGITSPYGGGLENFPRFLEDWNPEILLFRGSLVSLSFAQQATGLWGNGPYYRPPVRDWEFDTRFDQPENMPPGTPVVGNVIHTAFRPVF